ncbi:MAG: hypothetical protein GWO39_10010, partial [Gammaproteobacteria bacterium]|nr:hypothetical protein [Gammaproteobacteria bacterium]NIT64094.1 hypothetical protein [Gammaproteobacteria bacterium]NIV21025.1 hypothetical protein [Gammaproteobacteria bacterium]NIY32674.1 hypothetical protein [Gammaproteobacteria bacterium]
SLELASVDLNTLIQDMLQLLHVSMPKGVDLHTSFEDDLPALDVDPTQLRQVLMNLVMNAAEAMEERQGRVL